MNWNPDQFLCVYAVQTNTPAPSGRTPGAVAKVSWPRGQCILGTRFCSLILWVWMGSIQDGFFYRLWHLPGLQDAEPNISFLYILMLPPSSVKIVPTNDRECDDHGENKPISYRWTKLEPYWILQKMFSSRFYFCSPAAKWKWIRKGTG